MQPGARLKPILSPHTRIRHPEFFHAGEHSIVDDFCYFSTRVVLGLGCHIASGCSVAGGREHLFSLGDLSSLSSGVKIWCSSNDFRGGLVAMPPPEFPAAELGIRSGDVSLGAYTGVGANTVILPANHIPEGVAIGALSLVPSEFPFEPWTLYAGIPIRKIGARHRDKILRQAERVRRHWASHERR